MFKEKARQYWSLTKSLQTGLLLLTGLAGFMSSRCPVLNFGQWLSLAGSLFLTISASTVLNMWYDRDIDAKMKRTCWRPMPAGEVSPREGLLLGLGMAAAGLAWAAAIDPLYALIVFGGLFFDVVVYTMMLKRRTAWAIVWGGISGGMPVLAGRALGLGYIDWVGVALAAGVLFWIPTHILTFSMRYHEDYQAAGVPTFPSRYGFEATRKVIAFSSILATVVMTIGSIGVGVTLRHLWALGILSSGLFFLALAVMVRPSEKLNFGLFKYASVYMLSTMLLMFSLQ